MILLVVKYFHEENINERVRGTAAPIDEIETSSMGWQMRPATNRHFDSMTRWKAEVTEILRVCGRVGGRW